MGTTISPGKVNLYNQVFQSIVAMPFQQRHSLSTAKDLITFIKNVLLVICFLSVYYTHLRAHETRGNLVFPHLVEKLGGG
ncbi:hypothetical protein M9195_05905, partial [Apilactobacillus sp. F1]|nr:hypothetical protein [Apilactobacillus sp. F1]